MSRKEATVGTSEVSRETEHAQPQNPAYHALHDRGCNLCPTNCRSLGGYSQYFRRKYDNQPTNQANHQPNIQRAFNQTSIQTYKHTRHKGMGQNQTTRGPQTLVLGSICQGSVFGYAFLTHSHIGENISKGPCPMPRGFRFL